MQNQDNKSANVITDELRRLEITEADLNIEKEFYEEANVIVICLFGGSIRDPLAYYQRAARERTRVGQTLMSVRAQIEQLTDELASCKKRASGVTTGLRCNKTIKREPRPYPEDCRKNLAVPVPRNSRGPH